MRVPWHVLFLTSVFLLTLRAREKRTARREESSNDEN